MEKTYPARGDMTIMMHEKQNELTDISVALCSGHHLIQSDVRSYLYQVICKRR